MRRTGIRSWMGLSRGRAVVYTCGPWHAATDR
jgi:hypothetical protein